MPPIRYSSIVALEENATDVYMGSTEVLLRIARNILKEPNNPKFRSISLSSNLVTTKLLPASGAIECLFEMGFQEGSDKLILPPNSSLDHIKQIHNELLKGRELRQNKKSNSGTPNKPTTTTQVSQVTRRKIVENPVVTSIIKEINAFILPLNNSFLSNIIRNIVNVWRCESVSKQLKALSCVPLIELKKNVEKSIRQIQRVVKKKEIDEQIIDCQEILLLELCKWYKKDFFKWVDKPECNKCHNKDTKFVERKPCVTGEMSSIEVYECPTCKGSVTFPRYDDAEKLLETRSGRCGEWARCFYLICRSLGWDVRYVLDETDHVWVEVYSYTKKKWIHCDPCETAVDTPLLYECGWKKNLSYIIAYSKDDIQDVTWRYSCNHSKVRLNRTKCSEEQLVDVICNVRRILLNFATDRRKEFVTKRAALELVDLMVQKSPTEAENQGRASGSLAWRLARGEIEVGQKFVPFVWRPGKTEKDNLKFTLSYSTSADEYFLGESGERMKGWMSGLYKMNSVFRKEESDWKMVYLARTEGSKSGTLVWRFELDGDLAIADIQLKLTTQTYETGRVLCRMCNDETCVMIPNGCGLFTTNEFKGSKYIELLVEMSGGKGDTAWQHAQFLRQPLEEKEKTFEIVITLVKV